MEEGVVARNHSPVRLQGGKHEVCPHFGGHASDRDRGLKRALMHQGGDKGEIQYISQTMVETRSRWLLGSRRKVEPGVVVESPDRAFSVTSCSGSLKSCACSKHI